MLRYSRVFFAVILILGGISFLNLVLPKEIHFNNYLELLIFSSIVFLGISIRKDSIGVLLISASYLIFSYIYSVIIHGTHILDFLLAYKIFVYLIFLSLLPLKGFVSLDQGKKFTIALFSLFLIKYMATVFVFSINRPQLLAENNFELMFLGIMYYVTITRQRKPNYKYLLALILIFVLSSSRSGLIILVLILISSSYSKNIVKSLGIKFFTVSLMIIVGTALFLNRMGSLDFESIDRIVFFQYFLNDTSSWGLIDFLIGAERISPLSDATCQGLRFFSGLFSYSNDGSCYSVILHSFVLRVIYDHGIVFLLFIIYAVFLFLKSKGLSRKDSAVVCAMVTLNGLSVSSFNSVFFLLAMMAIAMIKFEEPSMKRQIIYKSQ